MEFRTIAGLPNGWLVGYQVSQTLHLLYPELPYFKRPDGVLLEPADVARSDRGEEVFRYVKRWLDIADKRYGYVANTQPDWRAMDKAKMAMHVVLDGHGRVTDDLLHTELDPHEAT